MDFWISVSCHFEVNEQLTSLVSILNFLLQLPDDKDDNSETWFKLETLIIRLFLSAKDTSLLTTFTPLRSRSQPRRHPTGKQEDEGGGGEGGGGDLQCGESQRQGAATLQVHLRLLHGPAARLQQLHRKGEMRSGPTRRRARRARAESKVCVVASTSSLILQVVDADDDGSSESLEQLQQK